MLTCHKSKVDLQRLKWHQPAAYWRLRTLMHLYWMSVRSETISIYWSPSPMLLTTPTNPTFQHPQAPSPTHPPTLPQAPKWKGNFQKVEIHFTKLICELSSRSKVKESQQTQFRCVWCRTVQGWQSQTNAMCIEYTLTQHVKQSYMLF